MSSYLFQVSQLKKYQEFLNKITKGSHAIILHSQDAILQEIISKLFVMNFECENEVIPCMYCTSCQKIMDNNALDIKWFGENKSIVVEDSNFIVQDSFVVPYEFKNKYYILKNFDNSTIQAQNKLLKVIEEPQAYVKFILLVNNLDAVLSTIKSRCEIYDIPRFETAELKNIFDFKVGDGKKVSFGAEYASGNLTKLAEIYEDEDFQDIYALCVRLLTNLKSSADVLEYSSQILKLKDKLQTIIEILILMYRDMLAIKQGKSSLVENKEQENILTVLSNSISSTAIIKIVNELQFVKEKTKFNANIAGIVDALLLKILEIKHLCK